MEAPKRPLNVIQSEKYASYPRVPNFETNPPDEAPQVLSDTGFVFWKPSQSGTTSGNHHRSARYDGLLIPKSEIIDSSTPKIMRGFEEPEILISVAGQGTSTILGC